MDREKKFDIELDELERQFRAQQRKLHPDKFVTRSEVSRAPVRALTCRCMSLTAVL